MNHEYKNNNFLDICSCIFLKSMLLIKNWCGMVQATLKIGGNFSHLNGFHAHILQNVFKNSTLNQRQHESYIIYDTRKK